MKAGKLKYTATVFILLSSAVYANGPAFNFYSLFADSSAIDTIENFDDGSVQLTSYADQDIQPSQWSLSTSNTFNGSPYSLRLYGNTWKLESIEPKQIDSGDIWKVHAYIESTAEIQGFGITDSVNTLLYSFAGTEEVDPDEWITVYQGAFSTYTWNTYPLPVGDDWIAKFGYPPEIKGIIFINDKDQTSLGTSYFDEIIDITNSLPASPLVNISFTLGKLFKNSDGLLSVNVQFTSEVIDPDSGEFTFFWNFGDNSISTEQNPVHTFIVEDDHEYTVHLEVTDETNLRGYDSCKVSVDEGETSFPVTMNFVGDIMLARGIDSYISTYGVEAVFNPIKPFLGDSSDITVANLECPLTNTGTPHPTKPIVFRGSPQNAVGLSYAGIDVVTLANNHIIDYGLAGLQQTQTVLRNNNVLFSGAGANSHEAMLPVFLSKSGVNIAFIASSDRHGQYNNYQPYLNAAYNKPGFADLNRLTIVQQINSVRTASDLVVFQMHSGSEYSISPTDNMEEDFSSSLRSPTESDIDIRRFAIDSGADVVICHHPHILHGFEVYKNKLIAHSLGNFVFDLDYSETYPTAIVNSKIDETGFYNFTVTPVYIDDYIPKRAEGEFGLYLLDDIANRSRDINGLLRVDRQNVIAEIILDSALITPKQKIMQEETSLHQSGSENISDPIIINRPGSISSVKSISPSGTWKYRLGRELVWFGNAEDEGCTMWFFDHSDEWFDTTQFYSGKRSIVQKRNSGLQALNTNFEKRLRFYPQGSKYSLHANIKTDNSSNAGVVVQLFDVRSGSTSLAEYNLSVEVDSTTDWNFYHNEFSLPLNGSFINIRLRSESPSTGTGYSWFDNIGVIEWTDWIDYGTIASIPHPNDYYWLQIKTTDDITSAELEYGQTIYEDYVTEVDDEIISLPTRFVLHQNYPNPFNPSTTIQYEVPVNSYITLKIYNILGEEVKTLVNELQSSGSKTIVWNGKDNFSRECSSGVYFFRLQSETFSSTKKMILIR